jgi:predicted nucleic acid-binding protein
VSNKNGGRLETAQTLAGHESARATSAYDRHGDEIALDEVERIGIRMKAKLYLETTIPSYLVGRPSRDLLVAAHRQITRDWWESRRAEFDLYVSELVIQEVRAGNPQLASSRLEILAHVPVLAVSDEILKLAEDLITKGPIPRKAAGDAAHIAIATVYGCEYLLTWNCRHIANAELHRAIRRVVEQYGYETPSLCTPEELMGEQQ